MTTRLITLCTIILVGLFNSNAQDSCKVLMPEISGKYQGKCKNGLAHGKGTAEGVDKYTGQFKNGLPDGQGTYIWSTGESFKGKWKAGKKDGEGRYTYKVNGADSVRLGIWKNDVFFRKIKEKQFEVLRTYSISRYSVRKVNEGNKIEVTILQNGSPGKYFNFQMSTTSGIPYSNGEKQGYEYLEFPVTCKIIYNMRTNMGTSTFNVEFEVQIFEKGSWEIVLNN